LKEKEWSAEIAESGANKCSLNDNAGQIRTYSRKTSLLFDFML